MNILFLGPPSSPLIRFIESLGDRVDATEHDINGLGAQMTAGPDDWLISYGYRYILRRPVLDLYRGRAINLHVGYLPWNRGADPNLWSWIDGTPKGVTIHHLDEGVDTGDIIVQRLVTMSADDTLATSYAKLRLALDALFIEHWPAIRAGTAPRIPQPGPPHRTRDRIMVQNRMLRGWDTPVASLLTLASSLAA